MFGRRPSRLNWPREFERGRRHRPTEGDRSLTPPQRVTFTLLLFFFVLFVVAASWVIDARIRAPLTAMAEERVRNIATRAITLAIRENTIASMQGKELASFLRDDSGRIVGVTFDEAEINRIASEATFWVLEGIKSIPPESVFLPLGQLLGLDFLAGSGPALPLRIAPVGSVQTAPRAEFVNAGINQVVHRITLDVQVTMRVAAPFINRRFNIGNAVIIDTTWIAGDVPQYLLNFEWNGEPSTMPFSAIPGNPLNPMGPAPSEEESPKSEQKGSKPGNQGKALGANNENLGQ